ncbi:hypothetical protein [Halobacteriovorax sp. HLS]|uniref:hypothetical protein n=1 Tax=Halobacteriovorax sp. HLS TaxID=2234000 RepID=UPI000FDB8997|nr:hypothetical protein [Halobacteriovorax sp. HLS]
MKLREKLLETLSFLEPMSLEKIYLDLDNDFLMKNKSLTSEDLENELKALVSSKKVKLIKEDNASLWIKIFPRKPLITRLLEYLKSLYKTK